MLMLIGADLPDIEWRERLRMGTYGPLTTLLTPMQGFNVQ